MQIEIFTGSPYSYSRDGLQSQINAWLKEKQNEIMNVNILPPTSPIPDMVMVIITYEKTVPHR